jgi:hypothetical protein
MYSANSLNIVNNKNIPVVSRHENKNSKNFYQFDRPRVPMFAAKTKLAASEGKATISNDQGDVLVKESASTDNADSGKESGGFFNWLLSDVDAEYIARTSPFYHYW